MPLPLPGQTAGSDPETNRINLSWLLRLRSGEIAGQLSAVLFVVFGLRAALPLVPLLAVLALATASNLAAAFWLRRALRVPETALGVLLSLDVLFFTALLGLTGGPYNPFSFLYLIPIALGALVLSPLASVGIAVLCFAADAALFAWHVWLPTQGQAVDPHELHHLQSHVQGMWIALAVASGFIVYFVQRVRRALAARERELAAASGLAQRNEKLASLATLSAGAAHELATPLSTIAVAARELELSMAKGDTPQSWQEDIRLVRQQVDRCRAILTAMAAHAGEPNGELAESIAIGPLLTLTLADLGNVPPIQVELPVSEAAQLRVPPNLLAQALQGIVRNAQQAAPHSAGVVIRAAHEGHHWIFEVRDQGSGMPPHVAARAGEPFFTTKQPGEGMGLGLFLARTTAEQLGGDLSIESQVGVGTRVRLSIPVESTGPQPA